MKSKGAREEELPLLRSTPGRGVLAPGLGFPLSIILCFFFIIQLMSFISNTFCRWPSSPWPLAPLPLLWWHYLKTQNYLNITKDKVNYN